jgi:hypothetical protein
MHRTVGGAGQRTLDATRTAALVRRSSRDCGVGGGVTVTRKRPVMGAGLRSWLWDTQMRRLPRALVALMVTGYVVLGAGAVVLAVQLSGGAA